MLCVVSYDIENDRVRTRLAKKLKDFGPRVQKSVFEADLSEEEFQRLLALLKEVPLKSEDSIRLYRLCTACCNRITIWGKGEVSRDQDFYIV